MHAAHVDRFPKARFNAAHSTLRPSRGQQEAPRVILRKSPEGRTMYSSTQRADKENIVTVRIGREDVPDGETPLLNWGLYRSSTAKWYHPEGCSSADSTFDEASGLMSSPMHCTAGDMQFEAQIKVPKNLEPVTLGCSIFFPGVQERIIPKGSEYLTVPIGMKEGSPSPLGATLQDELNDAPDQENFTVNFSVVSRTASSLTLLLVRKSSGETPKGHLEIALDPVLNKTGDVWHIAVEGLKDLNSLCYGWRTDGQLGSGNDGSFDSRVVLLDPYAQTIAPITLPESAGEGSGNISNTMEDFDGYLGCLSSLVEPGFTWESTSASRLPLEESVIYKLDLCKVISSSGPLLHVKEILDTILEMGANTILLQGIQASDGSGSGLPLHYFAINHRLASNGEPETARQELKSLVQACHTRGIEVMIEMEYCQSVESGADCTKLVSLKGLDPSLYFREGNLNWGHPVARKLVLDSLCNWVEDFKVDGFVFQNAEAMTQDRDGLVVDNPPLPETIAHDPVLRRCKMVAACGDSALLPRCGERGFPHWGTWLEWNRNFCNDTWAYIVEGQEGKLSAMATRVTGSPDLFAARMDAGLPFSLSAGRRPCFGLNDAEISSSIAGDPALQTAHAKCFLVAALTFQGVPVLPSDCLTDQIICSLVQRLTRLRDEYRDLLAPPEFKSPRFFQWHGASSGSTPMWDGGPEGRNFLAFSIRPDEGTEKGIYVGFNPHSYVVFVDLPPCEPSSRWLCLVDTAGDNLVETNSAQYGVQPNSAVVFGLSSSKNEK